MVSTHLQNSVMVSTHLHNSVMVTADQYDIAPPEEQCHNSKNAHSELCPRPYLPSRMASHVCFLKWLQEGRSVFVLMVQLHRPSQWFFLSPEKLYFSSCDSVLLEM
jgi:hypothetical protein